MVPESEAPPIAESADSSDDTIELELTGEQRRALSQAVAPPVAAAHAVQSVPKSFGPQYANRALKRTAQIDFICNVTYAVAALGIAGVFLWSASHRHRPARDWHGPAPAIFRPAALAKVTQPELKATPAEPAEPAEPESTPVRVRNAFDPTEVFEFPRGTTESEARKAVAVLLLSRARDRSTGGPTLRQAGQRRDSIPDASVAKLVAPARKPLNGTN